MSKQYQKTSYRYVNMSVCQYVRMSICRYVRMQLFSLGIKMKVVPNVIRRKLWKSLSVWESEREKEWERERVREREWVRESERESGRVRVRKPLRTAKEPALVYINLEFETCGAGIWEKQLIWVPPMFFCRQLRHTRNLTFYNLLCLSVGRHYASCHLSKFGYLPPD